MKEGDHIGVGMFSLLLFCLTLMYLIAGRLLAFALLTGCLGIGIVSYYWITTVRERKSWYWEQATRELDGQEFHEMWTASKRGDWLLWFVAHMVGKDGWPTHQQLVLASCKCARLALKYIKTEENRPLNAIKTAEGWARGEATLEQVRDSSIKAGCVNQNDTVYCAAQSAKGAGWAVYVGEDGACFRFAQAASDAVMWAAWAAGYEAFEARLKIGDSYDSARIEQDRAHAAIWLACADIVRGMLSVPNILTRELPIYDWGKRWDRNSNGQRTGTIDYIPIAVSRNSPDVGLNGDECNNNISPQLRLVTIIIVAVSVGALIAALGKNPISYYAIVRWLTFAAALSLIWRGCLQVSLKWAYLLVPVAIIFNPIIPIHIEGKRLDILGTWHMLDVAAAVVIVSTITLMEIKVWQKKALRLSQLPRGS